MNNICKYLKDITQAEYHKVDKKLEKYNLVNGQANLLSIIKDNDGAMQNELASILGIKSSSMSERLNKLEVLGYISRNTDEYNMRCKRIYITPEGRKAATQCNRILNEFENTLYKGFSKKDIKQFEEYFNRILKNIESSK